jgi:hypothetical protein
MTGTASRPRSHWQYSRPVSETSFSRRRRSRSCVELGGDGQVVDRDEAVSERLLEIARHGRRRRQVDHLDGRAGQRGRVHGTDVPRPGERDDRSGERREDAVDAEGHERSADLRGEGCGSLGGSVRDDDAGPAAVRGERRQPAHPPDPGHENSPPIEGSGRPGDPVEGHVCQRARRAVEPGVRPAPRSQCRLEEPVEHGIEGGGGVALGQAGPHLVEDLVLAEDDAVEPAGDGDDVARGVDVDESLGTGRHWREGRHAPGSRCRVHLDAVARVDHDPPLVGRHGRKSPGDARAPDSGPRGHGG